MIFETINTIIPITNETILNNNCTLDSIKGIVVHLLLNNRNKSIEDYFVSLNKSFHYIISAEEEVYSMIPTNKGSICNRLAEYNLKGLKIFTPKYCNYKMANISGKSPNNVSLNFAAILNVDKTASNNMAQMMAELIAYTYVSMSLYYEMNLSQDLIFFPEIMPMFHNELDPVYGSFWLDSTARRSFTIYLHNYIIKYMSKLL